MYIYIEIEDVVANAFINLIEKLDKREILFSELDAYGAKVIEQLNSDGETKAVLVVSGESQRALLEDYSDMFEAFERDGAKGIKLLDNVEPMDLWKRFCTSLSYKVLMAFRSTATKAVLGV